MRRLLFLSISLGIFFAICATSWAQQSEGFAADLSDREYATQLNALFSDAQKSIDVATSEIDIQPTGQLLTLIEALKNQAQRGLVVRLFLGSQALGASEDAKALEEAFFSELSQVGIRVLFTDPKIIFNDHIVVVDQRIVIEGGPPWQSSAIERELASGTVVYSESLAASKIKRFEALPLITNQERDKLSLEKYDSVILSANLVEKKELLPQMVNQGEEDLMKLYMILARREVDQNNDGWIENLLELYEKLGGREDESDDIKIDRVNESLKRLWKTYGLIRYKKMSDADVAVGLIDIGGAESLWIPIDFWDAGYQREISAEASLTYFYLLKELKSSPESTIQILPYADIADELFIQEDTLRRAFWELTTYNLIDLLPPENIDSPIHQVQLNALRNVSQKRAAWVQMVAEHGQEKFETALEMADRLDDANDTVTVRKFMALNEKYSPEIVSSVVNQLRDLEQLSPYRSVRRAETILEAMQTQTSISLVPQSKAPPRETPDLQPAETKEIKESKKKQPAKPVQEAKAKSKQPTYATELGEPFVFEVRQDSSEEPMKVAQNNASDE